MSQLDLFPDDLPEREDARALYYRIRAHLARRVVGHERVKDLLAVLGANTVLGGGGQRITLIGPSGVGKTTLVRALAEATHLPSAVVDTTELTETGWHGLDIGEVIGGLLREPDALSDISLGTSFRRHRPATAPVVVALDEFDKIATRPDGRRAHSVGVARDALLGKQRSLLGLLGGGMEMRYGVDGRDHSRAFRSDASLIVCLGVFRGLPAHRDPTPADLVRLGLMPELVERIGQLVRLEPLDRPQRTRMLRAELKPVSHAYALYGYTLVVAASAVAYVADAVLRGAGDAGPRSGATWLRAAAERGLVELLNARAPRGTRREIAPDDIRLPGADRSR